MQKILVLLAWVVLVAWAVRPVPGRGIPVGRGLTRMYFSRGQAVVLGGVLVSVSAIGFGFAISRGDSDFVLVGLGLCWLGALYIFHGLSGT